MASNRSPSPISSKNRQNSGWNSTTRTSFNGTPFVRPNALINPKFSNPQSSPNPPTPTDHMKRNSMNRKSTSSLFQDGKENQKDSYLRSPVKKNFMAPTISAASKFTPSPRKRILGEKNDVPIIIARASIQFPVKDSDFKSEQPPPTFEETNCCSDESKTTDESMEMLSGVTQDSGTISVRPFCCSPITSSPIVVPIESDPNLPPYDPKKNFLSPRPQFLRYKPNPRIENLLNKEGSDDCGEEEDHVTSLESSFNLSENSSDNEEEEEEEKECEFDEKEVDSVNEVEEEEKDCDFDEKEVVSVHGSSENLTEKVSEAKEVDSKVEKAWKTRVFAGSKAISFVFLVLLAYCCLVSVTNSPPMDLPIYKDVGFPEIYHESLKLVQFARESLDVLVANLENWSMDFLSYISNQKSQLFPTREKSAIRFFNLTVEEEFVLNRHIGTDYIQEVQEHDEEISDEIEVMEEEEYDEEMSDEIELMEEEDFEEMGDDYEVVNEQANEIHSVDDGFVESKSDLEGGFVSESVPEARSEVEVNDVEIASNEADSNAESGTMSLMSTKSLNAVCLSGLSLLIIVISAVFYTNKRKSNAKKLATIRVADRASEESCSSSVGNEHKKKKGSNKRESLAFSSSDFSTGSSYGSFTTLERIAIKNKDEVMVTPIRRSSRLLKNQVL
ncbi:hypothetical protein SSX86_009658 [Deinandra increscens subsp. villosa]|uniref:Transmembrane protein n=1 Tax=Deinandra increscens subsp. villosa TaxID=3103831 RepID=A0AAP0DDR4_9ASTR